MAIIVTPFRRRLAMVVLLLLAASGGVIRKLAPDPSVLRDIGTLLLVLWLPAIGNLIAFFVARIPHKAPPRTEFDAEAAFAPQLQVRIEAASVAPEVMKTLDTSQRRCTLLVGRHGFTARLAQPIAQILALAGEQPQAVELLHPTVALPKLTPGTEFHLLLGTTGIAKGRVA